MSNRQPLFSRLVACLVVLASFAVLVRPAFGQQRYGYDEGRFTGYVSTQGRVRVTALTNTRDDPIDAGGEGVNNAAYENLFYVWAEYLPGTAMAQYGDPPVRELFDPDRNYPAGTRFQYVEGATYELALVRDNYAESTTRILTATRLRPLLAAYEQLNDVDGYSYREVLDGEIAQFDLPADTEWVLVNGQEDEDNPPIAFPMDVRRLNYLGKPGEETTKQYRREPVGLIQTVLVPETGEVIESKGTIGILTDYFMRHDDHTLANSVQRESCDVRKLNGKYIDGVYASYNLVSRFHECHDSYIRRALGPIPFAGVTAPLYNPTLPGGQGAGRYWVPVDDRGHYDITYQYWANSLEYGHMYARIAMAPFSDARAAGTLIFKRPAVFGAVTYDLQAELQSAQRGATGIHVPQPQFAAFGATERPLRSVNIGVDAVYLSAHARLVNDMTNHPEFDDDSEEIIDGIADVLVAHPGQSGTEYRTIYDSSAPPVAPMSFRDVQGIQRYDSLAADLVHRGLLKQITQADLLNTDVYVFNTNIDGMPIPGAEEVPYFVKRGLAANDLYGFTGEEPNIEFRPQPDAVLDGTEAFFARIEPRGFIPHPGGKAFKVYLLNRVTGYLGTARIEFVNREAQIGDEDAVFVSPFADFEGGSPDRNGADPADSTQIGAGMLAMAPYVSSEDGRVRGYALPAPTGTAVPSGAFELKMRPPNIKVTATRVPAHLEPELHEEDENGELSQQIGFEGAGLTNDTIRLEIEWTEHDGTPLPAGLPGYSGRLAVATTSAGQPRLQDASSTSVDEDGNPLSSRSVGHFDIKPGKHLEVVRIPTAGANQHFYLHVHAIPADYCESGRDQPPAPGYGTSVACRDFGDPDTSNGEGNGALSYRPRNYVPIKVPIYDEAATRAAFDTERQALEDAVDAGETTDGILGGVKPVYKYVYRPEFQFSLYDLQTYGDDDVSLVTTYDGETESSKTALDFAAILTAPSDLALPGWGPEDRELLWGIGYGEYLALSSEDPMGIRCSEDVTPEDCELDDLDRLVATTPSAQLGHMEDIAGSDLTAADYLTLQLYSATDAGNVLYDLNLGYPSLQADAEPIVLARYVDRAELDEKKAYDDYKALHFRIAEPSRVESRLWHKGQVVDEGDPIIPAHFRVPGEYGFVVDYQMIAERIGDVDVDSSEEDADGNFILELLVRSLDPDCPHDDGDDNPTCEGYGVNHRVYFPGLIHKKNVGNPVGQVKVHNVYLPTGSVSLSRTDINIEGPGPELRLQRSYSNLGRDTKGVFGQGWGHEIDRRLRVLNTGQMQAAAPENDPGLVPIWVQSAKDDPRGAVIPWSDIEAHATLALDDNDIRGVFVNGTRFDLVGEAGDFDGWQAEKGRYAHLRLLDVPCLPEGISAEPYAEACFEFVARNGQRYFYPQPRLKLPDPPAEELDFSLSLEDGLAYRAGYMNLSTRRLLPPDPRDEDLIENFHDAPVQRVVDRFGNSLTYQYYSEAEAESAGLPKLEGQVKRLIKSGRSDSDAGRRSCRFNYQLPVASCVSDFGSYTGAELRLHSVSCLGEQAFNDLNVVPGADPVAFTVDYCYDARGLLVKAGRGDVSETYGYEIQPDDDGNTCGAESDPSEEPSQNPSTEDVEPNEPVEPIEHTDRTGDQPVELLPGQDSLIGYSDGDSGTGGSGTGGSGTGGGAGEEPEEPGSDLSHCPHNLVSFQPDRGGATLFEYFDGSDVDLGLETLSDIPAAEVVRRVTYPETHNGTSSLSVDVAIEYDGYTRRVDHMRPNWQNTYVLDQRGHPVSIVEPLGNGTNRTTTQQWGTTAGVDEGQLGLRTVTTTNPPQTVVTRYTYDRGNVVSEDTGESDGDWLVETTNTWGAPIEQDGAEIPVLRGREVTRGDGNSTTESFFYNEANGFRTSMVDKNGQTWIYNEHPTRQGLTESIISPSGDESPTTTTYSYDNHGHVEEVAVGSSRMLTYHNSRGEIVRRQDPRDNVTTYNYDVNGRLTRTTLPPLPAGTADFSTNILTVEYDGRNKDYETDRNGLRLDYTYTPQNQVQTIVREGITGTKTFGYDEAGNLVYETDWKGNDVTHEYNALGFRTSTTNREDDTMHNDSIDGFGNVWESRDYEGHSTSRTFDILGRQLTSRLDCSNCGTYQTSFDEAPNGAINGARYQVTATDPLGNTVVTNYDGLGRPLSVVANNNGVQSETVSVYDHRGNVLQTTDALGANTYHKYDDQSRRVATLYSGIGGNDQAGYLMTYVYDAAGNVEEERSWPLDQGPTKSIDSGGVTTNVAVTTRTYDSWNRVITQQAPSLSGSRNNVATSVLAGLDLSDEVATFDYDGEGNVVRQTDYNGAVRTWRRDIRGLVTEYNDGATTSRGRVGGACSGGTVCTEAYDANGNPTRVRDARNVVTEFEYDDEDRIERTIEAVGTGLQRETHVEDYDAMGRPTRVTSNGVLTETDYDARGLVESRRTTVSEGGDLVESFTYDQLARPESQTVQRVGETAYTRTTSYSSDRQETYTCYPSAVGASCSLNSANLESASRVDLVGNVVWEQSRTRNRDEGAIAARTSNEYDDFHRLETVRQGAGAATGQIVATYTYFAGGMVRQSTDADTSFPTTHTYDLRGRVIATQLPDVGGEPDAIERRVYDGNGNLLAIEAPRGRAGAAPPSDELHATKFSYDGENRPISRRTTSNNGSSYEVTTWNYDVMGNQVEEILPKDNSGSTGRSRVTTYDSLGRPTSIADRGVLTVEFTEYDARDNLLSQTTPGANNQNVVTSFTYDELNLMRTRVEIGPDGPGDLITTRYNDYDTLGNPQTIIDGNGRTVSSTYDHYGRRLTANYDTTGGDEIRSIGWNYDDLAGTLTVTETKSGLATPDTTVVNYDLVWGRPEQVARTQSGRTVNVDYQYHPDGTRWRVSTSGVGTGRVTEYQYDGRNRLLSTQAGLDIPTSYTYYADGRLDSITYPSNFVQQRIYNHARRVATIETSGAGGTIGTDYEYDDNGNRTRQVERRGIDSHVTEYEYDNIDRLEAEEFTAVGVPTVRTAYTFSGYNRATESVGPPGQPPVAEKDYTYTAGDHLTRIYDNLTGVQIDYEYDDNGNTLSKEKYDPGTTDTTLTDFDFDARDQLKSVQQRVNLNTPTSLGQYDYNANGHRVRARGTSRGNVDYFYDGPAVIEELDDDAAEMLARYHYDGGALAIEDLADAGSENKYYHLDALGTTTHLTSDGAIDAEYMIDAWGRPRDLPGMTSLSTGTNRKLYTGHEYDDDTGLHYMKARYMDPDSGRFVSRDSYLGNPGQPASLHRYMYGHGNPGRFVDPDGHQAAESSNRSTDPFSGCSWNSADGSDYQCPGSSSAPPAPKPKPRVVTLPEQKIIGKAAKPRAPTTLAEITIVGKVPKGVSPPPPEPKFGEEGYLYTNADLARYGNTARPSIAQLVAEDRIGELHTLYLEATLNRLPESGESGIPTSGQAFYAWLYAPRTRSFDRDEIHDHLWARQTHADLVAEAEQIQAETGWSMLAAWNTAFARKKHGPGWADVTGYAKGFVNYLLPESSEFYLNPIERGTSQQFVDFYNPVDIGLAAVTGGWSYLRHARHARHFDEAFDASRGMYTSYSFDVIDNPYSGGNRLFHRAQGINPLRTARLRKHMSQSEIGRKILDAADRQLIGLQLSGAKVDRRLMGDSTGFMSTAYIRNTQSYSRTAETLIHEGVHSLGVGGSRRAELYARMAEAIHRGEKIDAMWVRRTYKSFLRHPDGWKFKDPTNPYIDDPWTVGRTSEHFPGLEF